VWEGKCGCSGGEDWLDGRELEGEEAEDFRTVWPRGRGFEEQHDSVGEVGQNSGGLGLGRFEGDRGCKDLFC